MKHFYIAVKIEENGKYYAYVLKVSEFDDLLAKLTSKGIKSANICRTKKQAAEVVEHWKTVYKINDDYIFYEPF